MKSTGIIRKVDELGRIVLPIELRRTMDIAVRDELEIFIDNNRVVLQKCEHSVSCIFVARPKICAVTAARMSAGTAWRKCGSCSSCQEKDPAPSAFGAGSLCVLGFQGDFIHFVFGQT